MSFETVKRIEIDKTEVLQVPSPHIRYRIVVTAEVKSWKIWKRYSDFDTLDRKLCQFEDSSVKLPVKLPSKTGWFSCVSFTDEVLIEGRQLGFEAYLRALLIHGDSRFRESDVFISFLEVPAARNNITGADNSTFVSSEGWLQELRNCQAVVRDVRAILIQRENAFHSQQINRAQQLTAQARKQSLSLSSRLAKLEKTLSDLNQSNSLTPGEALRRQDIMSQLFHENSLLSKMVNKTVASEGVSRESQSTDRTQLLSSSVPHQPKSGRVFGRVISETTETRPLDNEGLLQLQKSKMEEQDKYISQFSSVLARQHQIGTHIGEELETHNQLLRELDNSVASTDTKIRATSHDVRKIS